LPLAYPSDPVMRVSHETIYLSLFVQSRGALRRELQRCLRTGRAMRIREPSASPRAEASCATSCISASDRPRRPTGQCPAIGKATWSSAARPSAVGTLLERHSRYVLLFPLSQGSSAGSNPVGATIEYQHTTAADLDE
jgi:transposase, IS30 family